MTDPIPPAIGRDIAARLAAIEAAEGVRYLLAVESGSRAWGFPSPDSDYDVRFVFVRPRNWYLRLEQQRDVIETPLEDDIDLNGWDIRKALRLLLKSNAVISEWLSSPIRYRPDDPMVARLTAFSDAIFTPRGMGHHHASISGTVVRHWLDKAEGVPIKQYLYALRSALSIRALRHTPHRRPSMHLQALMAESDLSPSLTAMIEDLVETKRHAHERGSMHRLPDLDALIRGELSHVAELPDRPRPANALEMANTLFLDCLSA